MAAIKVQRKLYPILASEVGLVTNANSDYPYGDVRRFGASPAATASLNRLAIQNALDSGVGPVQFDDGTYDIDDELLPDDNTQISLKSGTVIRQTTASKHGIKVVGKSNVWVHFNGGEIHGEGTWSAAWVGIGGHDDRGLAFYGCTDSGATSPIVRNCGLAGVVVLGGTRIRILHPVVEGTHVLGSPLTAGASYQFGYLVMHDTVYGVCDDILIDSPTAYYVNFGINTVDNVAAGGSHGKINVPNANFHDIIGQHGAYLGTSHTSIPNFTATRCGLDGIKFFSGAANEILTNIEATNFDISDCTGQAIEFGISGSGYIKNCRASGVARNCARAATFDGDVRHSSVDVVGQDLTQNGLYVAQSLAAAGPTDCEWRVNIDGSGEKVVYVNAPDSDRNKLVLKARHPGTVVTGNWALGVNACTGLTVDDLECSDDTGANMLYGAYLTSTAKNVVFTGTPKIFGYTSAAIRIDAPTVQHHWNCSGCELTDPKSFSTNQGNNLIPLTPLRLGRTTTVNANVPIWQLTMDDESVYIVTLKLVGKLSGSAERRAVFASAAFWRDAAGVATQQGATAVHMDVASAGFAGTYSFSPTVNDIRVLVNSAGAATYDWIAEVSVMRKAA